MFELQLEALVQFIERGGGEGEGGGGEGGGGEGGGRGGEEESTARNFFSSFNDGQSDMHDSPPSKRPSD